MCIYMYTHMYIYIHKKYLKGPRCQLTVPCELRPCLPLPGSRPLFPSSSGIYPHWLLLALQHTSCSLLHVPLPPGWFFIHVFTNHFCHPTDLSLRVTLPRKPSQTTTPLPGAPKTGQTPLYSIFRD